MAGVKIGDGAVIGRDAVVTKDVEPYQIVVGSPGKVVRTRFTVGQIVNLMKSQWWNIDYAALKDLPFDDVDVFLKRLEAQQPMADYASVEIRNRKIKN
jgi:hypothetical protein